MGKDKRKKDKKKDKKKKHKKSESKSSLRDRLKAEKALAKARLKANETPEERRARRVAKKRAKEEKRTQQREIFGYTNESNPFGDSNLTTAFVWKKKYDKTGQKQLTAAQMRRKQMETQKEIEKVKVAREKREREQMELEEQRLQAEKDRDWEINRGWEEREEEFHRKQAKLRSKLRIEAGREKAIDILAKNLNLFNGDEVPDADLPVELDVELTEPHMMFQGLSLNDLHDLESDIKMYSSMEDSNKEYWDALLTVCQDGIEDEKSARAGRQDKWGLHSSVQGEVRAMFEGKSRSELVDLEAQIRSKIGDGYGRDRGAVDVDYWEGLAKAVTVYKAKALLSDMHADMLKKRLRQLKQHHFDNLEEAGAAGSESDDFEPELIPFEEVESGAAGGKGDDEDVDSDFEGGFSPELLQDVDEAEAVDEEQDALELAAQRRMVVEQREREQRSKAMEETRKEAEREERAVVHQAGLSRFRPTSEELYAREAAKGVGDDEKVFASSEEIEVEPSEAYWWHDKYRPRKPRYFNRVKTGYEWNKYNQTHYDKENPPPKIVQGYKFNIFYPDLIDPSKPPSYVLEPCKEKDYCIIRFTAGPPYEDIAFKIVKKEWEYNHKRGHKCVFDRGVLHLYFNFRRYFYRR